MTFCSSWAMRLAAEPTSSSWTWSISIRMAETTSMAATGRKPSASSRRRITASSRWAASTVSASWVGPSTVTSRWRLKKIFSGWKCSRPSVPLASPLMALNRWSVYTCSLGTGVRAKHSCRSVGWTLMRSVSSVIPCSSVWSRSTQTTPSCRETTSRTSPTGSATAPVPAIQRTSTMPPAPGQAVPLPHHMRVRVRAGGGGCWRG